MSLAAVRSKDVVLLLSLFIVAPIDCEFFVFCPCFVMQYLVSFLFLQSSIIAQEMFFINCLPAVLWLFTVP